MRKRYRNSDYTQQSLLAELKTIAEEQGPDVTLFTFRQATGIAPYYIYDRWGNWTNLRKAAGLPVRATIDPVYCEEDLLQEYHRTVTELDDFPTHTQFNRLSNRCWNTLETRFGKRTEVQSRYRDWLEHKPPEDQPKFLKNCPRDCEPTIVPGLFIYDWVSKYGFAVWLLAIVALIFMPKVHQPSAMAAHHHLKESPTMPLLPPPQIIDHPADLVIDVFGTFLGKRSERLVVRWRETPPPPPTSSITDDLPPTSAPDSAPLPEPEDKPLKLIAVAPPSYHPADQVAHELKNYWQQTDPNIGKVRPSAATRLAEQLNSLADQVGTRRNPTDWHERAVPMSRLRSLTISGRGVTVSSDLIAALVERGIGLSFLSGQGQPVAQLSAPGLSGTVQTRRAQLAAYTQPLGVTLAVEFIRGKLRNQKHQLQYSGKYLKATEPTRYEKLEKKIKAIANLRKQLQGFEAPNLDSVRDKLMGYEGTGARLYWEGVAILLEGRTQFPGRETRGAIDPINSALNYAYGILYGQVAAAITNAGLEIFAGYLHVDRPGKPALVLDLIEEFRAPIVDRAILAIVNQGIALETDANGLTGASRKLIADRVIERLSTPVQYEGKRWPLGKIIQNQARHLAVAIRGERVYRAFASRW